MNDLYVLTCQNCGNKRQTDGKDLGDLVEIKTAPVPNMPGKKALDQQRRFRCPKCGYCFHVAIISNPTQVWPPLPPKMREIHNMPITWPDLNDPKPVGGIGQPQRLPD